MKTILACALGVFVTLQSPVFASDDHDHGAAVEAAPHGGNLRDAAPFKAELVITGDKTKMYVYDTKLKPIKPEKDTLTGAVEFPRQKPKTVTYKKVGDAYEATVEGLSKVHRYDLHVNLEFGGKKAKVDFGVDNI